MKTQQGNQTRVARRCFVASLMLLAAAAPVQGQSPVGSWLAFTGCWTPDVQDVEERPTLCVIPGEDRFSAEFVTVRDGEVTSREVARADGRPVDATQEGCEGTTTWRFSEDGHRVYHRSEHVCDGAVNRRGSGMMVMVNPTEWIDISSVEVEDQVTPWVQRYRMAGVMATEAAGYAGLGMDQEMALRAARMYSTTAPTITSITEASQMLHAKTVQAWLVESEPDMSVNAEQLIRMADAGVASDVIDVVVAVSHPQRFQLRDEDRAGATFSERDRTSGERGWLSSRDPWYHSPFGFGYNGYSPYRYGYSPYGYGYSPYRFGYGGYGLGYSPYSSVGYRPVILSVEPRSEPQGGRFVRGRGYVRGGNYSGGTSVVGRDGGRSTGVSVGSSGSSGGGRQSTGRTARPRGGSG